MSALTRGRLGSGAGSGGQSATPSTQERCATAVRESREEPVLLALNAERRRAGAEPLAKLTVRAEYSQCRICTFSEPPFCKNCCPDGMLELREEFILLALNAERRRAGAEALAKLTVRPEYPFPLKSAAFSDQALFFETKWYYMSRRYLGSQWRGMACGVQDADAWGHLSVSQFKFHQLCTSCFLMLMILCSYPQSQKNCPHIHSTSARLTVCLTVFCPTCYQVPALKAHLKGKWVGGQEWRPGSKKRSELIDDYRLVITHLKQSNPSVPTLALLYAYAHTNTNN